MIGKESEFAIPRNFLGLTGEEASLETARVVILPVPYEATSSYRSGTKYGPQAIIDASREMEDYDHELETEICRMGIHTLPEVELALRSHKAMIDRVYSLSRGVIAKKKTSVMLGGEHSLTLGAVRAYKERYPDLAVLQLDAHCDLRNTYQGSKYSHACVMRRVAESCPIAQVGIRSVSQEEMSFVKARGLHPFFYSGQGSLDTQAVAEAVARLGKHLYITIDLDVLDPSIMPAVGTPEPGGMGWYEVLSLLKEVCQSTQVVGFDVMELCPPEGPTACAYLAAKLTYKLIGYITTFCP